MRFQNETLQFTPSMRQKGSYTFTKRSLSKDNFCNIVIIDTTSPCKWQKQAEDITLTVGVAPKDYVAAFAALSRYTKTFSLLDQHTWVSYVNQTDCHKQDHLMTNDRLSAINTVSGTRLQSTLWSRQFETRSKKRIRGLEGKKNPLNISHILLL